MSRLSSPLPCVCSWALWCVSLPGPGELSFCKIPNNSVYLFQILNRPLWPSSQKSGMKIPASLWILWHPSGQYLSSASKVVVAEEMIYPTSTRGKLLISAVTPGGVHLFGHLPDHFGSTRQPGPIAVLLGQTLMLSLIFHQSLTLFLSTEKRLAAASPTFSSAYLTTDCLNFKSSFLFFLLHRSHGDHQCNTDWQKARTIREKGEEGKHAVSVVTSSSLIKKNKLDSAFIRNRRLFIKIYTCTWHLKGTLQLIETRLLFGNIRYIYTLLCKPGRERQRPCASTIHLQPGRGVVCVSSLLWLQAGTAARGYWQTDRLWVLLDGGGTHGSSRCSLSTVTAEWYMLSSQSLQTPQKSPTTPVKVARFVASRFWQQKKKSPGGWFVCVL